MVLKLWSRPSRGALSQCGSSGITILFEYHRKDMDGAWVCEAGVAPLSPGKEKIKKKEAPHEATKAVRISMFMLQH